MSEIQKFLDWLPTDRLDNVWWLDDWLQKRYDEYQATVLQDGSK